MQSAARCLKTNLKQTHEVVAAVSKEIIPEIVLYDYAAVLKAGEKVIEPVNTFFDNVMVMDEDENVKNNRLAMLEEVRGIVNAVGDLSCWCCK